MIGQQSLADGPTGVAPASKERARLADLLDLRLLDTPPEERFDRLVRLASRIFETPIAYISLIDENRQWFKASCGLSIPGTARGESFCTYTIQLDEPLIIPDAHQDDRFRDLPLVVAAPLIRFYAGHPLRGRQGHNVGTLCLAAPEPRRLDEDQLAIFRELAALAEHELNLFDLVESQQALLATQKQLAAELTEAAAYVQGLLPAPIAAGPVAADWRFIASSELGGDLFDYRWLDDQRLVFYLLDVCGHGVGAALLSVSVRNHLRSSQEREPGPLLTALNDSFPMEQHGLKYFTIWYGTFHLATRELRYACAGHPPAVRLRAGETAELGDSSLPVGAWSGTRYGTHAVRVESGDRIYLFSDGAYEVTCVEGGELAREEFSALLREAAARCEAPEPQTCVAEVLARVREIQGAAAFRDDWSLVELRFA